MGHVDHTVNHLLYGCDAGEVLRGLFGFVYCLCQGVVESVCAMQNPGFDVVSGHVSVHRITDVHQSMGTQYNELAMSQKNLQTKSKTQIKTQFQFYSSSVFNLQ